MDREKRREEPEFDIDDRDFNVKAWYLKDTDAAKGHALILISYKGKMVREFFMAAYKIWNIAAHFKDIVDGELSKDDKDRGYRIALSTGLEGLSG